MANLTGLTQNFFPTASETYANNLSSSISALAATVAVNSANEYADGDVATITVDAGTANEATFTGVKASSPARFTNCVWTEGNLGVGHASGATVIDYDSATHMSQVSKGILVEHKQNGQHRNINADSVTVNGSITATGDLTENGVTARVYRNESDYDFVASGGIWSLAAGLNGTMTALTAYITGYRSTILAVASRAFTASKDTYVDVLRTTVGSTTTFSLVYTEVANGATAPALAANSIRLAIVITSGAAITSVLQGPKITAGISGFDTLGYKIYPTVANSRIVGRAVRNTATNTGASASYVGWNGMSSVRFRGTAGKTYKFTIHEPILDGYSGTSGLIQMRFGNDNSTSFTNVVGIIRCAAIQGGNGFDGSFEFTALHTGLQYINIQYLEAFISGTININGDTQSPAMFTVEEVA